MKTVNVIEFLNYHQLHVGDVWSFPSNEDGFKKADEILLNLIEKKEPHLTRNACALCVLEGEYRNGNYAVIIVTSNGK